MYDVYTPLSETDLAIGYDEALEKAEKVLAVFGKDYADRVHRAFTERWIDVHVNKGKRSGAYSGGSYDTNAFMLLNWQDTLDNLYTLVHETATVCILLSLVKHSLMCMGIIVSSWQKLHPQRMKTS
ncbi:oligoendopeptidase F [Streptococcus pyogenes]|nr:oligoendopeptidase F [Streptococcus pyogenes]